MDLPLSQYLLDALIMISPSAALTADGIPIRVVLRSELHPQAAGPAARRGTFPAC